jgi:RecJ-like exonuclease
MKAAGPRRSAFLTGGILALMDERKPHENLGLKRKVCADCEGFGTTKHDERCQVCGGRGSVPDREPPK